MQAKRTLATVTLLVSCAMFAPVYVRADAIITFNVSGGYRSPSTGTFSGTLTVDVTTGTVTAVDITFPSLAPFDDISTGNAVGAFWFQDFVNSGPADGLQLGFATTPRRATIKSDSIVPRTRAITGSRWEPRR